MPSPRRESYSPPCPNHCGPFLPFGSSIPLIYLVQYSTTSIAATHDMTPSLPCPPICDPGTPPRPSAGKHSSTRMPRRASELVSDPKRARLSALYRSATTKRALRTRGPSNSIPWFGASASKGRGGGTQNAVAGPRPACNSGKRARGLIP